MVHRGKRGSKNRPAPVQDGQQSADASMMQHDETMGDAPDHDMQVAVMANSTHAAANDAEASGGEDTDHDGDYNHQQVLAQKAYTETTSMILAGYTPHDIAKTVMDLADAAPTRQLAAMAAVGADGNQSQLLLAASAISLQQDLNQCHSTIDARDSRVRDDLETEIGYNETRFKKMEGEIAASKGDIAALKEENGVRKVENQNLNTRLEAVEQKMAVEMQQLLALGISSIAL